MAIQSDTWFQDFLKLEFLIDEITGDNIDNYTYTWHTIIHWTGQLVYNLASLGLVSKTFLMWSEII